MSMVYWIPGVLAICVVGLSAWVLTLPEETSVSRTTRIEAPVDVVFDLVTDVGAQASWRSDVESVEVADDGASWVERTSRGVEIAFREEERQAGLYVISYRSAQGFAGDWRGRFSEEDGGTHVSIVETTRTEGLLARAMARVFVPAGAHVELYLDDLARAAARRSE